MTVAMISTRFSPRPDAAGCDSCDKQEERCRASCASRGYYKVRTVHPDDEVSGGVLDRPGLAAALRDLADAGQEGEDAVLVVDTVDRLPGTCSSL